MYKKIYDNVDDARKCAYFLNLYDTEKYYVYKVGIN